MTSRLKRWTTTLVFLGLGLTLAVLAGCDRAADVASRNLSEAADNFEIVRKITFYNTWTDTEMLEIEGRCAITPVANKITVTCRTGHADYVKHYLGLGGNVTYMAEQLKTASVSEFHHRIQWRPQTIIPDIDFQGDMDELIRNKNTDG